MYDMWAHPYCFPLFSYFESNVVVIWWAIGVTLVKPGFGNSRYVQYFSL